MTTLPFRREEAGDGGARSAPAAPDAGTSAHEPEAPSTKWSAHAVATLGAAMFALLAFLVALVSGIASGRDAVGVMARSLAAMAICWLVGWIALLVALRAPGLDDRAPPDEHAR